MRYEPLQIGDMTAEIPIIQGGMGVGISLGNLAGAVAKEGAVGIISAAQIGYREPDFEQNPKECNLRAIEKEYKKAKEKAQGHGIVGFNIMVALRYYEEYVRKAVEAGADLIISGAGLPTDLPKYVENSNTKIAPIVSSEKSARVILKYWDKRYHRTADLVVIEGPKAGGHLGFTKEQLDFYEENCAYDAEIQKIREVVQEYAEMYNRKIPVVAAGGIDTSEEMERVMSLGVQGVQIASRFVTTKECDANLNYKMAYINARKEDICIVKSPVGMPGRAIKNAFMERVMSGEKIPPKKCLGCLQKCNPKEIPYCITEALIHAAKGETEEALLFCGANAYKADSIQTVKEVIDCFVDVRV
ncbi:MAG: nitronate monooxygenase family protein [Bacteroidales bacterium]|nr:nitronate monooxygenase family protein [Lachnoclostridium sp.]MCM1384362.1 nitronate monooxygenase family protein [Lachnoclostridium sp.]MCM1464943.1 nitronate monooxygenase family protein [Bacteroidales bacterium]